MSRDIKFRARDRHDKEWVYFEPGYLVLCKDDILQQWTGLTDKNGKDIYEGDIVEWSDSEPNIDWYGKVRAEVSWQDGGFFLPAKGDFSGYMWQIGENNLEIIGNIYENGDLLK